MNTDIKYVIKRVVVGVLVFLAIFLLKKYLLINVKAMTVASETMSFTTSNEMVVTNVDTTATFTTTVGYFGYYNGTSGYIRFPLSVNKVFGGNTNSIVLVHGVAITVGSTNYVCEVGNNTIENSTYNGSSYSVMCPVNMVTEGMTKIYVRFTDLQSNDPSSYRVRVGNGASYEIVDNVQVNVDTNGIINNNTQNTQDIINNNNQNTQDIIESSQVCSMLDKNFLETDNAFLLSNGNIGASQSGNYAISSYVSISSSDNLIVLLNYTNSDYMCFYNINKDLISCLQQSDYSINNSITIPSNSSYFRFTINKVSNRPQFKLCRNGNQAIVDSQQDINNTLNNSNTSGATSSGSNYFLNFSDPVNPLLDVLLFPIHLLDSANDACNPIHLSVFNQDIVLPCGNTIFWDKPIASDFRVWWNLFVGGLSIYLLSVQLFHTISDAVDPFKDGISQIGGL